MPEPPLSRRSRPAAGNVSSKCALRRGDTAKRRGTLGVVMATTIPGSALSSRVASILTGQLTAAATHGENGCTAVVFGH
jgi:hypothetical protein